MTRAAQLSLWVLWFLALVASAFFMLALSSCAARRTPGVLAPATSAAAAPAENCADMYRFGMEAENRIEWLGSMPIVGLFNGHPAGVGIALELEWGLGDNGLLYWKKK